MWNNSTLTRFIKDNSSFSELLTKRPTLENNPLVKDNITKDQVDLRRILDNIQGTNQDNELTGQLVEAITIGSKIEPIPKDHPYSSQEIGDFLKHSDALKEWNNYRTFKRDNEDYNAFNPIELIPILSCLYSIDKQDLILVMSSNDNNVVELETETISNIVGRRLRNRCDQFRQPNFDEIDGFVMGIDFEDLRRRLITSGYSELVNQVDEQLAHY
jgi:hypothetical protein